MRSGKTRHSLIPTSGPIRWALPAVRGIIPSMPTGISHEREPSDAPIPPNNVPWSCSWEAGAVALNKNGFILAEALMAMMIVGICVVLLVEVCQMMAKQEQVQVDEEIQTQWFYTP